VLPFATMHDELLIFNTRVRRDGQVQESLTFAGTIGYKKNSLSLSARTHASKLDSTAGRRGFPKERPICRWFRESSKDLGLRLFLLL